MVIRSHCRTGIPACHKNDSGRTGIPACHHSCLSQERDPRGHVPCLLATLGIETAFRAIRRWTARSRTISLAGWAERGVGRRLTPAQAGPNARKLTKARSASEGQTDLEGGCRFPRWRVGLVSDGPQSKFPFHRGAPSCPYTARGISGMDDVQPPRHCRRSPPYPSRFPCHPPAGAVEAEPRDRAFRGLEPGNE